VYEFVFDPKEFTCGRSLDLSCPMFLAIISSDTLATSLARKPEGRPVDGFILEGPAAGGHNAPPRGGVSELNERGEPIYGARDAVNMAKIRDLGLPFWLAGSYGHPDGLAEAESQGANGVQVGTAFALCQESGMAPDIRSTILQMVRDDTIEIITQPRVSSTGFPIKIAEIPGSLSDEAVYEARNRICDHGYLREPYVKADGTLGYRCSAEPVDIYVKPLQRPACDGGVPAGAQGRARRGADRHAR